MWAVKLKGRNLYAGQCGIPSPGLTFAAFPGNENYWPVKFSDEAEAERVAKVYKKNDIVGDEEWEVIPYPK